jgi:hypothetical protein
MAYFVGALLASLTLLFASLTGLERARALYPLMLIAIGAEYELFAAFGGPARALWAEAPFALFFIACGIMGFRVPLAVPGGLVAHALFDALHPHVIQNAGVPSWWPTFCLSFDLVVAAVLAVRLFLAPSDPVAARRAAAAR